MKFRYYKPKDKLSKFNEYFDLLDELFHFQKGYTEEEFLYRIASSAGTNAPDHNYVFRVLLSYGLIAETNDLIPRYILSHTYRTFLEYLYQDSQPVNSHVIQGYIAALDQCIDDISNAYDDESIRLTHRHLVRLGREMDTISQTSARNRLGVVSEVRKLKLNDEKLSYKERLAESNRLWDEYLEPLREMIAPSGAFGILMDRLKQALDSGEAKFTTYIELRQQFSLNRAKRMLLNEQTRHDLNEAQQELAPLREKLTQESRLLEASAVIFEHLEQGKLNELPSLPLGRILKHERQISLSGSRGFLANLWAIKVDPEPIQFDEEEAINPAPLETEELMRLLKEMPEHTNLIDYFMQQHEGLSAKEIFRAVSIATLHQQKYPITLNQKDRNYEINGQTWHGASFSKGKSE